MQPSLLNSNPPNLLTPGVVPAGYKAAKTASTEPISNEGIDPTIKALASAIGETETGTSSPAAYTKKGASGEYGRYQFMPETLKLYSKKYLGDESAPPTVENQNKIVYKFIEEKKKAGYTPAQIASMWNAGEDDPDAYKGQFSNGKPSVGRNSMGVQYDVPGYTKKVSEAYERLKGQQMGIEQAPEPQGLQRAPRLSDASQSIATGQSPQRGAEQTFMSDLGQTFGRAGNRISTAVGQGIEGQINPLSAGLQALGGVAGGVGDLTTNVLEHTPIVGKALKGIEGLIGKGVGKIAQTNAGKGLISNYQQFAKNHPEAAGNLGAAFDIATAVPVLKGLSVAKNAAKGGVKKVLKGGTDDILEAVSPSLGPKGQARALMERGTVQKGLLRETQIAPDPKMVETADLVRQHVPKFDPNDLVKSVGETQKSVNSLRASLKKDVMEGGQNRIYPTRELISKLRKIEKPDLIAADNTLNNVYDRLVKRVESIATKRGGKTSDLLDVLGDFDGMVKKQYPNLYRSEALTPLRQGVKDIREAIKDFAVDQLPNVELKERMLTVHKLINAMENMSEKAVKGAGKQVGTNAATRFGNRHPVLKGLVKTGTKAAVEGTGIGAMLRILD